MRPHLFCAYFVVSTITIIHSLHYSSLLKKTCVRLPGRVVLDKWFILEVNGVSGDAALLWKELESDELV